MSYKTISTKTFEIGNKITIVCESQNTRYGFRHLAVLRQNGFVVSRAKACYYNRTWERYEFESVLLDAGQRAGDEIYALVKAWNDAYDPLSGSGFGTIGLVAAIGDLFTNNQKDANDWKLRMIRAGLGDSIQPPADWDELDEDEKERRLNRVIQELRK